MMCLNESKLLAQLNPNWSFEKISESDPIVNNFVFGDYARNYHCRINQYLSSSPNYLSSIPYLPVETNGWYIPTNSTSDYFRKKFASNGNIINYDAGVPVNLCTSYINKQEAFAYNPNNNNQNRAYCGIYMRRKFTEDGTYDLDYTGNKNEYIQQKLASPLLANHHYEVKFRVSRADSVLNDKFALKHLAAYFTEDYVPDANVRLTMAPIPVQGDQNLVWDTDHGYYFEGGGIDGTHWDDVEGYITPTTDLNYVTIGHFLDQYVPNTYRENGDIKSTKGIPATQWGVVDIYYFIDSLEITEVDEIPCNNCGTPDEPTYKIELEPVLKTDPNADCCFDVYVTVADLSADKVCPLQQASLFTGGEPNNWTLKGTATCPIGNYPKGVKTYLMRICVPPNQVSGGFLPFKLTYNYGDFECFYCLPAKCVCECEPNENTYLMLTQLEPIVPTTKCCWKIQLVNNSTSCLADIKAAEITSTVPLDVTDYQNPDWIYQEQSNTPKSKRWNNQLEYMAHYSATLPLELGIICLSDGEGPLDINFNFYNSLNQICNSSSQEIKCRTCCEELTYHILNLRPALQGNIYYFDLHVDTTDLFADFCNNIYGIQYSIKYQNQESEVEYIVPLQSNPINFYHVNFVNNAYTVSPNEFPHKIIIKMLGSNGQILCEFEYEVNSPPLPRIPGIGTENTLLSGVLKNFILVPNPATSEATLKFDSDINAFCQVAVYNNQGLNILDLSNNKISSGMNSLRLNLNNFVSGKYYIRISCNNNSNFLPFIISK